MLRLLSRGLLAAALGLGFVAYDAAPAYAQDDDFDDSEDEGGGDEGDSDSEEGDDEEEDKDQPPLTAGGLFTLKTYPVREISRPLTMTQGITQARMSIGTDLSAKGAFESAGISLEAIHGYRDNFSLLGGFTSAYNLKQFSAYFGFEGALAYDLVDFRMALNIRRSAIPATLRNITDVNGDGVPDPGSEMTLIPGYGEFCNPPSLPNEQITPNHLTCTNPMASVDLLPTGKYVKGRTKFSIDIGLPFRYAIKPEIAIVALQTLMSIDLNSVSTDYVTLVQEPDGAGGVRTRAVPRGNDIKPDLNPSIGIATNPIAPLSVVIFAQLRVIDFDTSAGAFQVPVTGRIQFSPNQKFDVGLEFILLNVKPPEGQSPIDNRYLALFAQSRFGK